MGKRLSQLNQVEQISPEDYLLIDGEEYLESKKIKFKDIDINKFNTDKFYNKEQINDQFIKKEQDKDLSSNDFTDEYKAKVDNSQEKLVNGENIKSINGESILGSGNIIIKGGAGEAEEKFDPNSKNAQSGIAVKQATLSNVNYNNKKVNDVNNIVGYKGYHMISSTLSDDQKSITIELRDANLDEKAVDNYKVNDLVCVEANTHLYQQQKITAITSNDDGNTLVTLTEVSGKNIQFYLEPENEKTNWIYVAGKCVGEEIPQFAYATASGIDTIAAGYAAFTTGRGSRVYGNYGTAIGRANLAAYSAFASGVETKAIGLRSLTSGLYTLASGDDSVALGQETTASGRACLAIGSKTTASKLMSFAGGDGSQATGEDSFAFGLNTLAQGDKSVAFGRNTKSLGLGSFVSGQNTEAEGTSATAVGYLTKAKGHSSFAGGSASTAEGEGSMAFGFYAQTGCAWQAVFGKHNDPNSKAFTDALLIVGNGKDKNNKSDAFTVNSNGTATVQTNPIKAMDVATKQYVDNIKNEIDNALIELHNYAQALINGGAE